MKITFTHSFMWIWSGGRKRNKIKYFFFLPPSQIKIHLVPSLTYTFTLFKNLNQPTSPKNLFKIYFCFYLFKGEKESIYSKTRSCIYFIYLSVCNDKVLNRGLHIFLYFLFLCDVNRFCLDRNDKGSESEEEILAEEDQDDIQNENGEY